MQAIANANFPFAGSDRKSGDIISADDWNTASPVVRKALLDGQYITLKPEAGESGEGGMPSETSQQIIAMLETQANTMAVLADSLVTLNDNLTAFSKELSAMKMREAKRAKAST